MTGFARASLPVDADLREDANRSGWTSSGCVPAGRDAEVLAAETAEQRLAHLAAAEFPLHDEQDADRTALGAGPRSTASIVRSKSTSSISSRSSSSRCCAMCRRCSSSVGGERRSPAPRPRGTARPAARFDRARPRRRRVRISFSRERSASAVLPVAVLAARRLAAGCRPPRTSGLRRRRCRLRLAKRRDVHRPQAKPYSHCKVKRPDALGVAAWARRLLWPRPRSRAATTTSRSHPSASAEPDTTRWTS